MPFSTLNAGRQLDLARVVLLVVLTTAIVSMIFVVGYGLGSPRESIREAQEFVRILRLETPSLVPSGRVTRNSAYRSSAVDLRPTPLLPVFATDSETLLGPAPKRARVLPK